MKERPILFSGAMVRAILDGRKTQTRRVIDPDIADCIESGLPFDRQFVETDDGPMGGVPLHRFCPYGVVGDRLWVKETFSTIAYRKRYGVEIVYAADGIDFPRARGRQIDSEEPNRFPEKYRSMTLVKRPSIFMPRWASRITLEIIGLRAERLQDMTYHDWCADFCPSFVEKERALTTFTGAIQQQKMAAQFWDSINGKKHPWKNNDFVWVIEFRRVE